MVITTIVLFMAERPLAKLKMALFYTPVWLTVSAKEYIYVYCAEVYNQE